MQVEKLRQELETQKKEKEALEARANEAERKIKEFSSTIESVCLLISIWLGEISCFCYIFTNAFFRCGFASVAFLIPSFERWLFFYLWPFKMYKIYRYFVFEDLIT